MEARMASLRHPFDNTASLLSVILVAMHLKGTNKLSKLPLEMASAWENISTKAKSICMGVMILTGIRGLNLEESMANLNFTHAELGGS